MNRLVTKALLGLCIAAPAMAKLPVVPNRYGGVVVRTSGFTSQQRTTIRTSMGLWLQGLQRQMPNGSANFRVVGSPYVDDYSSAVTFTLVSDTAPTACALNDALDKCAVEISGHNGTSQNIAVKVYTQFTRVGRVSPTRVTDPMILMNISIRTFGRILGLPFAYTGAMNPYLSAEGSWANQVTLPSISESNAVASIYGLGDRLPNIVPILEYSTKSSSGSTVYGFTNTLNHPTLSSEYTIRTTNWVANTIAAASTTENILQGNGQIRQPWAPRTPEASGACGIDVAWGGITIHGLSGTDDLALALPISKGAPRTAMVRNTNGMGDYITIPHPGTCLTGMGDGVDLFSGS